MDVYSNLTFHCNLSDREWRVITKGLAQLAGLKVTTTPEDRKVATELNTAMLEQRARILAEQLRTAEAALAKAQAAKEAEAEAKPTQEA